MTPNALVSIIIPTYRQKEYFKEALDSLVNQSYKNIEIIVIDDNGDFNEYSEYVTNIIQNKYDKRIKYFKNSANIGSAQSKNRGIELSMGDYITFLDDDDYYTLNKV